MLVRGFRLLFKELLFGVEELVYVLFSLVEFYSYVITLIIYIGLQREKLVRAWRGEMC